MSPRYTRLALVVLVPLLPGNTVLGEPPESAASVRTDHYGDPLPKGARFRLGTVRLRHNGAITALTWLPDGHTLASASWDGTLRLWQIPGGKQRAQWANVRAAIFSPDGRSLACEEEDGVFRFRGERAIRFLATATGKELHRFRVPKTGSPLATPSPDTSPGVFSSDGKILAVINWEKGIHLYAVPSGQELRFLEAKLVRSRHALAFSPDGRILVAATTNGVYCWNICTGAKQTIPAEGVGIASSFAFSPDGKMLAATVRQGSHSNVLLWSWPACKELRRLVLKDGDPKVLAFSANGKFLATGECRSIRLWDSVTGKQLRCFKGHRGPVWDLAFSPDGSLLASAGDEGTVAVWELRTTGTPRPLTGTGHHLDAVCMTPDGRTLLTHADDGALTLWDGRVGRRLRTLALCRHDLTTLLLAADGRRALALPWPEEMPLWWDVASGQPLPAFSGIAKRITCAAFSADSELLALGEHEGVIHLFETGKGRKVGRLKAEGDTRALAFSPDGRALAADYSDGRLILWDLSTSRPYHWLRKSRPNDGGNLVFSASLVFSADSRLLAEVGLDKTTIQFFETVSGQTFRQLHLHPLSIESLDIAPDNRTLATGDQGLESAVRLWDLTLGEPIHVLYGHQRNIKRLAFSADGATLLSSSWDDTIVCWDVADLMRHAPASKELSAARLTELWSDLAAKDAVRGQRAVTELILASDSTLPFLAKALPPVPPEKMAPIAALIADLDQDEFIRRERASKELQKIGAPAVPALHKVLKVKPTLEVRKRIMLILETMDEHEISPAWLRTVRVLQVLETIGTPEARCVLEGLARGAAEARLTCEAKAAVQRLDRRNARP